MGLFGKAKDLVGLDIGSHSVKLVELKQRGKAYELVSFGIQPLPPDSIVEGAIMDSSAVADAIELLFYKSISPAEQMFLNRLVQTACQIS